LADADGLGTLHYAWQSSTSSGGFIPIGTDQPTYTLTGADVGSQIRVSVFYTDGDGTPERLLSGPTSAVLTADTAPTIISNGGGDTAAVSIFENTTAVALVTATDADGGQTLTYSIPRGADAALLTIDASTGALAFATPPNFEAPTDANQDNVYAVTVQVSDGLGGIDTQALAVTVTDVNEAPVTGNVQVIAEDTTLSLGFGQIDPVTHFPVDPVTLCLSALHGTIQASTAGVGGPSN